MQEAKIPAEKLHECKWAWWQNPVNSSSWRLTKLGHELLKETLKVESLTLTVKNTLSHNKTLLLLEKYLTSPFYIQRSDRIVFFGGHDSIMLTLMDNNLDQYLENLSK
ncbi:hypothetical protein UFOVP116_267 [uncultured Caudovirales phage]|uniref:Uncharacterized protein n=1 Tax=uncultured Caudovirales phage TaxID=2100421 RepID=A0A6J5L7V7_9CAUD|nr:hypothetical protein UFOVP116_267 [uncultured Caudovirales phage]